MAKAEQTSAAANMVSPSDTNAKLDAFGRREVHFTLPFGALAFIGALGSLFTCYVGVFTSLAFGLGIAKSANFINPHLQAVIMWGLALVAVYALWRDRDHHASDIPIALGGVAVAILIATLYISYDNKLEILAYVLLMISALLNQNAFLGTLNRKVTSQAQEIEALNRGLTEQVETQVEEIDRLGQLKRFLAPQVAELVIRKGGDQLLNSHRRYIACLFCDLRNFTTLSETIEPEEVMSLLTAYHEQVDALVAERSGTIGFRSGDGLMAFFNDPALCDKPTLEAVRTAIDIRSAFEKVQEPWIKLGHSLGLGIGIASGYATLGLVGSKGKSDYTAIGGVVNLASRLCDQADSGQILIGSRAFLDVEQHVRADDLGQLKLKGVADPIEVHSVVELHDVA